MHIADRRRFEGPVRDLGRYTIFNPVKTRFRSIGWRVRDRVAVVRIAYVKIVDKEAPKYRYRSRQRPHGRRVLLRKRTTPLLNHMDRCVPKVKLSLRECIRLFAKTRETLGMVHVLGVVHRDWEPSDIRAGECDESAVFDFGLAELPSSDTNLVYDCHRRVN